METTKLGATGRLVSRLGFGGATAGLKNYLREFDPENPDDREPVIAALQRALELGITYFDTAAGYGDGVSERIFGEGLAEAEPGSIFVATKVGPRNWRPGEARRSLERSLTNLRRDHLELLQIHGTKYAPEMVEMILRPGGMLDELEALRAEGLVSHLGFTIESEGEAFARLVQCGRFEVVQLLYNLLFQHPFDPGWRSGGLYDAARANLGTVVMRSTTSGIFQRWVQEVNPANTFDYTPALIQFSLACPLVDVVLVGMRSAARVEQNVAIAGDLTSRVNLEELYRRYV